MKIELHLHDGVYQESRYLVHLQQTHGAPVQHASVGSLLAYLAAVVADGSRRPGAWERQILEMTGQLPQCDELAHHRAEYGNPETEKEK